MAGDLDPLDFQIIELLLRDGRTPAAQIAEQIGLGRSTVAERIEKLERQGVIRGTTAVIEPAAIGRGITAFISARGATLAGKSWKAFQEIMKGDEVLEVHTVAGEDCFLIKVRTSSIESLNALVRTLTHPPLSLHTRTTIVMQTHCEKVGGITLGEPAE